MKYLMGKVAEAAAVAIGTAIGNFLYDKLKTALAGVDEVIDGDYD